MQIVFAPDARAIMAPPPEDDFWLSVTEAPRGTPAGSTSIIVRDHIQTTTTTTGSLNAFVIAAGPKRIDGPPVTIESLTPDVCTINPDGTINLVSEGGARIRVSSRYGERMVERPLQIIGDTTTNSVGGYVAGSLAEHVYTLLTGYYSGRAANDTNLKVSLSNGSANPNRVAPEIDMSWRSAMPNGDKHGASLISARHALAAVHVSDIGQLLTWRRPDGSLVTTTNIGRLNLGSDLAVLYLSQDVTGCAFVKLAPNLDLKTSLGVSSNHYELPAFIDLWNSYPSLSSGSKLMVASAYGNSLQANDVVYKRPSAPSLTAYHPAGEPYSDTGVRGGDSGGALFIPVVETPGQPPICVHLTSLHTAVTGPPHSRLTAQINAAMNTLAGTPQGTYQVREADLSRFPSYT